MVLSAFGLSTDEAQLRRLTDCSPLGTDAFQIVEAARILGFSGFRKCTLTGVEDLAELIGQSMFPIVYVDMWTMQGGQTGRTISFSGRSLDGYSNHNRFGPGIW